MNSFPIGGFYTISLNTNPLGAIAGVLTNADLLAATVKRILYKKPNGAKGHFDASVSGITLEYDFQTTSSTPTGDWCFEAYVETGGQIYLGAKDSVRFEPSLL